MLKTKKKTYTLAPKSTQQTSSGTEINDTISIPFDGEDDDDGFFMHSFFIVLKADRAGAKVIKNFQPELGINGSVDIPKFQGDLETQAVWIYKVNGAPKKMTGELTLVNEDTENAVTVEVMQASPETSE